MQFLETLKFLSGVGVLPGNTIGSMSCSGGEASMIADCADSVGLDMPLLSDQSVTELDDILGPKVPLSNPLDYHMYAWGDHDKLTACFTAMLKNRFACTMLVLDYPPGETANTEKWEIAEQALTDAIAATGQCAVIVSTLLETMPANVRTRLKAVDITPMQGLEECLYAIRAAALIGEARQRVATIKPLLEPVAITGEACALDEWQSKRALARYGLQVPEGKQCNHDEAVKAAEALGYPVVLKALSAELAHKSELDAVAVDLGDGAAVAKATTVMAEYFDRFLVEKMAGPTVAEIIIGVGRDDTFGLTLLVGAGGTLVELLDDTASLLLPADRYEIEAAIRKLKVAKLIEGFRGGEMGDFDAIVDAVIAVAAYAVDNNATLAELDVNPLIVMPSGAIAVDAYIRTISGDA